MQQVNETMDSMEKKISTKINLEDMRLEAIKLDESKDEIIARQSKTIEYIGKQLEEVLEKLFI